MQSRIFGMGKWFLCRRVGIELYWLCNALFQVNYNLNVKLLNTRTFLFLMIYLPSGYSFSAKIFGFTVIIFLKINLLDKNKFSLMLYHPTCKFSHQNASRSSHRNITNYSRFNHGSVTTAILFVADIKCGHPPIPLNARLTLSSPSLVPGTIATYRCDEGYETFGNTQISCSPSGQWAGEMPFCGMYIVKIYTNVFFLFITLNQWRHP